MNIPTPITIENVTELPTEVPTIIANDVESIDGTASYDEITIDTPGQTYIVLITRSSENFSPRERRDVVSMIESQTNANRIEHGTIPNRGIEFVKLTYMAV